MANDSKPALVTLHRLDWETIEGLLWELLRDVRRGVVVSGWKAKAEELHRVVGKRLKTDANERFTIPMSWGSANQILLMLEDRGRHGAKARLEIQLHDLERDLQCGDDSSSGAGNGKPSQPRKPASTSRRRGRM